MALSKLEGTDHFVIQRTSEANTQGGHKIHNQYFVSAEEIGKFAISYFDNNLYPDLETRIEQIEKEQVTINESFFTIFTDLTNHEYRIVDLEEDTKRHTQEIAQINRNIDDALHKSKINIYYKLVDNAAPESGEMCFFNSSGNVTVDFTAVTKIRYNILDEDGVQNRFMNIYEGETMEITIMGNRGQTLTHRAVYYMTEREIVNGEFFDCEVEVRHSSGTNDSPIYNDTVDNLVRTDFYPIFSIQEDTILAKMDEYLPLDCKYPDGTEAVLTDKLSIHDTDARLHLWGSSSSAIKYKTNLRIKNRSGETVVQFNESSFTGLKTLRMSSRQIKDVAPPSESNDVVTKTYLEESLKGLDVSRDELFQPGDPVAAESVTSTDPMGFYYAGGSLYFVVSK